MTALIFSIAAFGMLATMSLLRPAGKGSARKLEATYIGKQVIDDLRKEVDATTWTDAGSNLAVGTHTRNVPSLTGDFNYEISYTISDVGSIGLRKMDMTITYPDE